MDYSADYPTDYPHGLPYGLPPRTTLNKQTNLRLRGKETQEAYLLQLHDHNCMKSSRHFLFTDFLCPIFFPFSPHFFISYQPKRNAVSIGKHRWISVSLGTVYTDAVSFVTTSTGRNHMFPYFWNVAETCNSMFPLYLRLAETWKLKCYEIPSRLPSHVSAMFKLADFRYCAFPSCFCKRIYSCLLHLPKHKPSRWFLEQQWILAFTIRRRTTAAAAGSTSPHIS